jgi:hypothetical protein
MQRSDIMIRAWRRIAATTSTLSQSCTARRRARLWLETLEDRCLLSALQALAFDGAREELSIFADPGGVTAQVALTNAGALAVTIDGQVHSSEPAAASYDPALAGVVVADLHEISLTGGAADMLSLGNLSGSDLTITSDGFITVDGAVDVTGRLALSGQVIINTGRLSADGNRGGEVRIDAGNFQNSGTITADGLAGDGGTVHIAFTGAYIETTAGLTAADGGPGTQGGQVTIDGGASGHLFSSGTQEARGGRGGSVTLLARDLDLVGSVEDASATGGAGGRLLVRANGDAQVYGQLMARGSVSGGAIEVSAGGKLTYGGNADAGATVGPAGSLLLDPKNLVISSAPAGVFPQYNFINPDPMPAGQFGFTKQPLSTGNVVILDPNAAFAGAGSGAAYLFNGQTGALISAMIGTHPSDGLGSNGIALVGNGNYVISSIGWNNGRGAATWGSGTSGVAGIVSADNSLVGSSDLDNVSNFGFTLLTNGNYVVNSPYWNGERGAATWGDGNAGVRGEVSAANSLVGSHPNDLLDGFTTPLTNGNYVVSSPFWNGNLGATTWGNGSTGSAGAVSAANSLISAGGAVSTYVFPLSSGNYVVTNQGWNGFRGAATWGSGTSGVAGPISAANSLVGSNPNDLVGNGGVRTLPGGNYVVSSLSWNDQRGAATWGDGSIGLTGTISAANSLVGDNPGDIVGGNGNFASNGNGIFVLTNGNYVVATPSWNGYEGAVTWGSGSSGVTGVVSAANSLVGTTATDAVGYKGVAVLSNGNYVVTSPGWNSRRGAATWANGTRGVAGPVSAANSLVGTSAGDQVGYFVTPLSNGNYVVQSANNNRGAATWGSGTSGVVGTISAANSLIGPADGDFIGSVTALTNGNYVVLSPVWNGNRGAATWGNGASGTVGTVSAANSFVGTNTSDKIGLDGVTPLAGGAFVVLSRSWNNSRGAVTWGSGTGPVSGTVSAANSLVGSNPNDFVGFGGVTPLANGNYVVLSNEWNNNQGVATWGSGTSGVAGVVSAANSLLGASGFNSVFALSNANYVVSNGTSATWVNGTTGVTLDGMNTIEPQNSLMGTPGPGDSGTPREELVSHTFVVRFDEMGGRVTAGFVDPNLLTFDRGRDQTIAVTPDFLTRTLNTGTAVVLQASNDITVNSPIIVHNPAGNGGALTLDAGRSILLNASIDTGGGNLTLIANDTLADGVVDADRDPGNAAITMASGVTLNAGVGTVAVDLKTSADKTNNGKGAATLLGITAGSTTLSTATVLGVTLGGTTPGDGSGTTYTQTNVTGPINLGGATLALTSAGGFTTGQTFPIVKSTQPIIGTFVGLPEGAGIVAGGQTFKISYQNNQVSLTVTPMITFGPSPLPAGMTGTADSQTLTGSGGTAPYHDFIVTAGALPAGLTLSSSGTISGPPTATGAFTFTMQATDSSPSPGPYPACRPLLSLSLRRASYTTPPARR